MLQGSPRGAHWDGKRGLSHKHTTLTHTRSCASKTRVCPASFSRTCAPTLFSILHTRGLGGRHFVWRRVACVLQLGFRSTENKASNKSVTLGTLPPLLFDRRATCPPPARMIQEQASSSPRPREGLCFVASIRVECTYRLSFLSHNNNRAETKAKEPRVQVSKACESDSRCWFVGLHRESRIHNVGSEEGRRGSATPGF